MSNKNPSILSHVSLGTNEYPRAREFYGKLLAVLGCRIIMEHEDMVAFGRAYPEFWVHAPHDGRAATVGNGTHVSFAAASQKEVDAFHRMALSLGAADDGAPGKRPHYGEPYYGCFVRDLDGNKIEATFWDDSLAG